MNKRQRTVVWLIYHQSECQEEVIFVNFPCAAENVSSLSELARIAVHFMIETLRNYDGDGNENLKKVIGLISKTTTLYAFSVHFFAVPAQLRREMTKFTRERERQGDKS